MADFAGDLLDLGGMFYVTYEAPLVPFPTDVFESPRLFRYRMRGRDANCVGLTYREWMAPVDDVTADFYLGAFCGASKNFTDIVVINLDVSVTD